MSEMNEMSCVMLADAAAELALGVLTGRERADAIEHLDRCEACREDVRKLMATGDELLGLLPAAEPPAGFETRVLNRLGLLAPGLPAPSAPGRAVTIPLVAERGLSGTRRPSHRRPSGRRSWAPPRARQLLASAAVVIAFAGAGIGGWSIRTAPPSELASASLASASHGLAGHAWVYRDSPHWIYMVVDLEGGGYRTVSCELIGADGQLIPMGMFRLNADGYGWWSSPLPATGGLPRGARVIAADDGTVLASATF
jgi:hypothetical protein